MAAIEAVRARAMRALIPPPRLKLSAWIEENVILPDGITAQPGPVRLWPFQREIADAIGDPLIERVTLVKPVRVGFTTLLTAGVASFVANDPAPILVVLPTEADCRDYMVSDLEPTFSATQAVANRMTDDNPEGERNTILSRRFPGGSLKVVAAKSPRNLRRHNVRVLVLDEVDGMEDTAEGPPTLLAERRTLSFPDRKIVMGSTPVYEETSRVLQSYAQSDRRIYEVPCPDCGDFHEIMWKDIHWPEGQPMEAAWHCPSCGSVAPEKRKPGMVAKGRWRATKPEVKGHAGFRFNALVSLHANASWGLLAQEFAAAAQDKGRLQVFANTILAEGWRGEGEEIDEGSLIARAGDWGIGDGREVPADVLYLTAGVDVQRDRVEITLCGWSEDGAQWTLGHRVAWGAWDDAATWAEVDTVLTARYKHALGGTIGVDATCVDAGDGVTEGAVMGFCGPRLRKKVFPIKGDGGNRPLIAKSTMKTKRLWIVGSDTGKTLLFGRVGNPALMKFSADLPPVWFEQLTSERAVIRFRRGQPTRVYERITGRAAEALDCTVYAMAARNLLNPDWYGRREQLALREQPALPQPKATGPQWIAKRDNWL